MSGWGDQRETLGGFVPGYESCPPVIHYTEAAPAAPTAIRPSVPKPRRDGADWLTVATTIVVFVFVLLTAGAALFFRATGG